MARNGRAGADRRPFDRAYLFEWNPRIIRLYLEKLQKKDSKVRGAVWERAGTRCYGFAQQARETVLLWGRFITNLEPLNPKP
jgi:hypothetical protein